MSHRHTARGHYAATVKTLRWGAIALACFGLLVSACNRSHDASAGAKRAPSAIPVVVADAVRQAVPVRVTGIGNVESIAAVAVKSRVDGQIVHALIADGAQVHKGQVLFEIDARPFVAQLEQARANLMRDQAVLAHAQEQDTRYRDLLQKHFISPDAYSQVKATLDSAKATVAGDQAAIDSARLQVDYATIRSPLDGRAGKIMIPQGNLVKANDTNPLVVINQLSPIYVSFAVPERYLENVRQAMLKGAVPVDVSFAAAGGATQTLRGKLAFVDNSVDAATGTVKLRAILGNHDDILWPGQFVHASALLGEQKSALVIPSAAVQNGPNGPYAFVVDPARMTAQLRELAIERVDGAITIVAKGVAPGDKVVVDGQSRLVPGAAVKIAQAAKAS